MTRNSKQALRVAAIYILFASLWILFSDRLNSYLFTDPQTNLIGQTVKGWFFVLVTGSMLFFERKINQERLLRSETKFSRLAEQSIDGIFLTDSSGKIIFWNSQIQKITGTSSDDALGKYIWDFPEILANINCLKSGKLLSGSEFSSGMLREDITITSDGKTKNIEKILFSIEDHKTFLIGGIFHDISPFRELEDTLRKSLEEKETLLKEIHHRVKNNLQIVSSLLSFQKNTLHDQEAIDKIIESQSRIRSIALVHESIYQSKILSEINFGEYSRKLIAELTTTFGSIAEQIKIVNDIRDIVLSVNQVMPLGLILNELLANSFKHAFNGRKDGILNLSFHVEGEEYVCVIKDNGPGVTIPDGEIKASLGLNLVKLLVKQLGGSFETRNDNGACFRITFPIDSNI